jgi:regulator of sigma E protease
MLTLIAFVLVVGTLVVVHEFGHYLAARFIGVRVETFSIGFPPNIYRRRVGDTEWTIGLLPLGGYVKMAGDAPGHGGSDPAELQNRTRGERLAILFAGPAMNFVLAVAILAGLFYVGMERRVGLSDPPVVSYVAEESPARLAGLRTGDRILSIAGEPVSDWRSAMEEIIVRPDQEVAFDIERSGEPRQFVVHVESRGPDAVGFAGIAPPAPPIIGAVSPGSAAEAAGILPDDLILRVDQVSVGSTNEVAALVQLSGIREISLGIERAGREIAVSVTPKLTENPTTGEAVPMVGVSFRPPFRRVRAESVPDALQEAVAETVRWGGLTVGQLARVVRGEGSARQFSGPIGIAQASGEALRRGPTDVLLLMAILSLSLGVLNLLPIPVLDGGQIAVLLVESAARRDLSLRVRTALMVAGAAFMLLVFVLVVYLDLSKTGLVG